MRIVSFLSMGFLIVAFNVKAAPAPVPKGDANLPAEAQLVLETIRVSWPAMAARNKRFAGQETDEKRRKMYLGYGAKLEKEFYTEPVTYLELALTLKRFEAPRDQNAIREALERYRKRLQDAKTKGLVK